jgi:hypothetical protein
MTEHSNQLESQTVVNCLVSVYQPKLQRKMLLYFRHHSILLEVTQTLSRIQVLADAITHRYISHDDAAHCPREHASNPAITGLNPAAIAF